MEGPKNAKFKLQKFKIMPATGIWGVNTTPEEVLLKTQTDSVLPCNCEYQVISFFSDLL